MALAFEEKQKTKTVSVATSTGRETGGRAPAWVQDPGVGAASADSALDLSGQRTPRGGVSALRLRSRPTRTFGSVQGAGQGSRALLVSAMSTVSTGAPGLVRNWMGPV